MLKQCLFMSKQFIPSLEKEIFRCSYGVFIPSLAFYISKLQVTHMQLQRHHDTTETFMWSEQFGHCSSSAFLPLLQTTTFKINCISSLSKVSMNTSNCAQNHQTQNGTVYEITSCSWARDQWVWLDLWKGLCVFQSTTDTEPIQLMLPWAGPLLSLSLCIANLAKQDL